MAAKGTMIPYYIMERYNTTWGDTNNTGSFDQV